MAILALHRGVSAEKREAILVILNLLNGIVPTKNGVTLRAIRAHLALVNIGVAILTILPHIREYRFYVALYALHSLVHAAQRIVRFVVIEFGDRANGAPARSGVAVLARNRERSVRTTSAALLTVRKRSARRRPRQKHQPQYGLNTFRRKCPTILLKIPSVSFNPSPSGWALRAKNRAHSVDSERGLRNCPSVQFWARSPRGLKVRKTSHRDLARQQI